MEGQQHALSGRELSSPGFAEGEVLASTIALSFWGGVSPPTGIVIDTHHPLAGSSIKDKVLVIPGGRGSCSGSAVILELFMSGSNPCALIFKREELILTLGVIVAQELFQKTIPVLQVSESSFETISHLKKIQIVGSSIKPVDESTIDSNLVPGQPSLPNEPDFSLVSLTAVDREMLNGEHGRAARFAMRVILRTAFMQGVTELIDIKQAHIDCCIYTGPAVLKFAQTLREWGAKVRVPTTLNSISIDRRLWRAQGVDPAIAEPSEQLAQAYLDIGAKASFTCAPYQLESAPRLGDNIMWAESNAVVYANSVLGARTIKCPDFLDVCVALTGRSLNMGCHLAQHRMARVQIHCDAIQGSDDAFYPLLGYLVGDIAADRIPIITGLEKTLATTSDLKAFGAAFATTSSAPMFHIAGITVEARNEVEINAHLQDIPKFYVRRSDLTRQWHLFNVSGSEEYTPIDLVSLGNPHFSYEEIERLADLTKTRIKTPSVALIVTCNREIYARACKAGFVAAVEEFGGQIITDSCWCMIQEPIIPKASRTIMTNSAKYSHYGKGLTGRQIRFGGLVQCVEAACSGRVWNVVPSWLEEGGYKHGEN
ncbi:Aconitase/3-isopropylmalate dehydratase large subunit alpha/beta/alpha subdomain 1/3 [Penicillium soppii]|jgi:predicted aconitase/predicted aconitase with swiveling domain|uniref:Aconitase/3-isopropylmalate dehydratase large subunit alpha/beta/alpha subdomain 1/3 n=1 Tax=Penicillium soppii TaxID=69789 RepID=UPI002549A825|nr:Aconitase/3-isopropylmalate dehydratase large subunit alpha/beta/alpha subdomain 1/3 [Penicillium soppii]KAJ5871225.1 Aconitase/3-isopropylmalate dehydratase large subunit alpha/beta/alpha subdomain 1/3 [Penicillium soppii]